MNVKKIYLQRIGVSQNKDGEKIELLTENVKISYSKIIKFIKKNNIKTIVINSPSVNDIRNDNLVNFVSDLCKKNNIPFINFTRNDYPEFNDLKNFVDQVHLSKKGADLFSTILSRKIVEIYPELKIKNI